MAGANGTDGLAGANGTAGADGSVGADGADGTGFSNSVDVDATAFTAHLTISGSNEADVMLMGSGGSDIYATLGSDSYTLGSGVDILHFTSAAQSDGTNYTDSFDGFTSGQDKLDLSALVDDPDVFSWDRDGDNVNLDLNGDTVTDMTIELIGATISDDDFVLA
jgi:hypothetical protein